MKQLKTISAFDARQRLGELLEEVHYRHDRVMIKRGRKPMAVLISTDEYENYIKQRGEDFHVFHEIREKTKAASKSDAESDIDNAIQAVRKRHVARSS